MTDAVFSDQDVTMHPGDGIEDPQSRRVGIALSLAGCGGLFGHFVTESLPARQRRSQPGNGTYRTGPGVFTAIGGPLYRLHGPVKVYACAKKAAECPLNVRAQRSWRGVYEQDSTGCAHVILQGETGREGCLPRHPQTGDCTQDGSLSCATYLAPAGGQRQQSARLVWRVAHKVVMW